MELAKSAINALFKGLGNALARLEEIGLEKKKEEDIEEDNIKGKYLMYETADGNVLELKLFAVEEHPNTYLVRIRHDEGEAIEEFVEKNKITKFVTDYAHKYGLGTVEEGIDVNDNVGMEDDELFESTKIAVTLQRVSAGKEDTINLCAINAGTDVIKAMNILDQVLSDDTFVATITEEPKSFEIVDTEDAYDVENTDTVDTSKTFEEMLRACVECYHNLECIHWAAKGKQFKEIHSLTESLLWDIRYNSDTIAEWCVEFTKEVPNVLSYQYTPLEGCDGFDFDSAVAAAKCQIDNYVKVLECYYVNVDHDVQSVMDNWIRDLKKKSNYVLERSLTCDATRPTDCTE